MMVGNTTGAVSHEPVGGWHSIDWNKPLMRTCVGCKRVS